MFLSLDLETAGLETRFHSILSVGLVLFDHETKYERELLIDNEEIIGQAKALVMNVGLLERIADAPEGTLIPTTRIIEQIRDFIHAYGGAKITVVGKNVASFDLAFLKRHGTLPMEHGVFDIGSMCYEATDHKVPNTAECFERIKGQYPDAKLTIPDHNALNDARFCAEAFALLMWGGAAWL